ncbi:hypothetical protein MLD38_022645 [Melastoma candidum]|uniref:Uncharacterized protein n=1 Tax=Melastoma candidum TaxID=119954 RepID=A0ACB9QL21_9MYRT|nr:hypothetical protein MLD38_022645 [Melastoma candidum]
MSSDSEDFDEDELLQMALKEQSQRDTSYAPASRKPVANFVQPPKTTRPGNPPNSNNSRSATAAPGGRGGGGGKGGPGRRSMDEDEDSEVEMLSISSGDDEDDSVREKASGGGVGRATGGGRRSSAREDDRGPRDGEEPDCWKYVDEAELVRRVRDMRETRVVPVAQKFEKKASTVAGKGLHTLQSFPRGMECIDPLGLGIIDNKSLRLITDTSDYSPSKADRDYVDGSTREKFMYFSDKFESKSFISRIHQDTSAADLEAGALSLKNDLRGRTQQRKQLVKENFDCFVSCKTTIDDIESKLRRIEEDPEGSGTTHLYNCIQGVTSQAGRAFETLFERQAQAEKIRSVQGMLQRFRTLFNLPSTIRTSISKGEYDLAVREYKKAKSITLPSHVGILKRVLEEVDKVMQEFKGRLYKLMEDPHIDLTNLENTVRLLLELEPESDPVWHYLNIQNQRIRGLLEKCTFDHEGRMEALLNELRDRAASDARWRQIQQNLNSSLDASSSGNVHISMDSLSFDLSGEEFDALRGKYIHRLTTVMVHHVPAFWKVAVSIFSGKFAKSSQVSNETNPSTLKPEEKVVDGKYSSHSLDEVSGMIKQTIAAYEVKVINTFRELGESNVLHSNMNEAIIEISKACQTFEVKESAPRSAVLAIGALHFEVTKMYILRLCSYMRSSTEEAAKEETWVQVSVLERNKSPYTISYLPLTFRSIIASTMDHIHLMIQAVKGEAAKSEDVLMQLQEILESVRLAFLNCFLDFAGHLEQIGFDVGQIKSKENLYMQNGFSNGVEEKIVPDIIGSVSDPHQRLLIVLSNIGYCKDELSHELYNKYRYMWLGAAVKDEGESDLQDLVISFSGLEEKILELYTFAKANLIREAAVSYFLDSGIQWGSAPAVKGVRDAAVDLLHTLVAVHAEVYAGAKPLLDKTLGILVEGLIDTFLSLLDENRSQEFRSLDANGFCQITLELEYFETVLNPYFTPEARESLKSLQGVLLEMATESMSEGTENPGHNRRATRGSEDALSDERQQAASVSPDDLIALAQQYSSELLQAELERTRINTACFVETIPLDTVPEPARAAYASFKGPVSSPSRNYRGSAAVGVSPSYNSRQRRR